MQKEITYVELAYDFDSVVYKVSSDEESKQVRLSLKSLCSKQILANGGHEMLEQRYPEFKLPESEWDQEFDVSLAIDTSKFPRTQKVKKNMDEETANKVRAENDLVRQQRLEMATGLSTRVSEFKKDFLSAPIRKFMNGAKNGEKLSGVEIPYRQDESYWLT